MTAMKNPRQVPLAVLLLSISLMAAGAAQGKVIRLGTSHDPEYFNYSRFNRQSVTVMKDGRFAVVWTQFPQSPLYGAIAHVQYIGSDGSKALGPFGRAVTSSNIEQRATSVVAHAEEGVLVALERFVPGSEPYSGGRRLVVQRLDGRGHPRWHQGVFAAPASRAEYQSEGALLASSDGGAFACFIREGFLQWDANIFCQRFSADGQRLWGLRAVQAVTSPSTGRLETPPLAVADDDGGLLVFWQDVRTRLGSGTVTLRGQRFGPDGSRLWGDEGRIVYTWHLLSHHQVSFTLVSDGSGGAILAFDDWPGPPSPIRTERVVIVQRVSGDGDSLWGSGGLVVASGDRWLDSLIAGPDGGAFVGVMTYDSNSNLHLAFHRITADGRSIWPADGVPIADPAVYDQDDVQASGSFDDGVLRLAWMHYVPVFRYEIRFGALDADGNRLAGAAGILLAPADSQKTLEGFAVNPETGTVFAAWVRYKRDDIDTDVHGAVYDSSRALTPAALSDRP
jgi:hypothetical protein